MAEKKKTIIDVRTTMLTSVYTCAYKTQNSPYEVNPANTFHGDLLNLAATSNLQSEETNYQLFRDAIKEWKRIIKTNATMKDMEVLLKLMITANKDVHELRQKYSMVVQEQKMYILYKESENMKIYVNGTSDLAYYCDEIGMWAVEDLKCSTHSYYSWEDMWLYNMQTFFYPLMVMIKTKTTKCWFRYRIGDKNSGKFKFEPQATPWEPLSEKNFIIRTFAECSDKLREVMEEYYLPYENLWEAPARMQKLCHFCDFKNTTCPLKKHFNVVSVDVADDYL